MLSTPGTVLRRLVTDPVTGVLVDYGTSRYRPDTHLSGLTKARDVTCRYPGCTRNRDPLLIRFRYPAVSDSQ
jgi:hypothetical protein